MPRKGENIFKRKDGRWEARYIKGRDLSGKARYGYCYGRTYSEAKNKVSVLKAQVILCGETRSTKVREPFDFYCDKWLFLHKASIKPSTYAKYSMILDKYIKPHLGKYTPDTLSMDLVEKFKSDLLTDYKLSPKSVKDILQVLKMAIVFTRKQFPGTMTDIEIIYPREQKHEMRVLTREEQKTLINYLHTNMDLCKFGTLLALTTGLRIGELCALRWSDISLQDCCLTVASTIQRVKSFDSSAKSKTSVRFGQPKSEASSRSIPLTNSIITLCKTFLPDNAEAFVLTGTEKYMEPRTLQYRFKRYTEECGLDGVHFHTLRHTFATRCVEVGFEIKSLSEILGHSSTSITLNRYVHSSMEFKRNNIDKLAAVGF